MNAVIVVSTAVIVALTAAALLQFALTKSGSIDRNAMIGIKTSAITFGRFDVAAVALVTVLVAWLLAPQAELALAVVSATGLVVMLGLFVRVALSANHAARNAV